MQGEADSANHFTEEMIDSAVQLWVRSAISLIDVRYRLIDPDSPIRNYRMPSSMLVYTFGGMANVQLDHTVYHPDRYGLFHGGKGTELSIDTVGPQLELYLVFYKADAPPFFKKELSRWPDRKNPFLQQYGFSPANPIFFVEKLRVMHNYWRQASPTNPLYAKILLYQLVHEIYEQLRTTDVHCFEPDLVAAAKRYMDEQYMQPISIQALTSLFPISGSQLSRLFKRRERKSLQEYLNEKRLDAARQYLQSSQATVKEIADGCGFANEINLLRLFKKYYRMTPSQFRRKMSINMRNNDIDNNSHRHYNETGLDKLAQFTGDGELSMLGQKRNKEMILAAALSLMLLLSACTANAPANNNAAPSGLATTPAASSSAESTPSAEEIRAVSGTRAFTDVLGREVTIPAQPKKVVALWAMGELLALWQKPVGATTQQLRLYSETEQAGVEVVGDSEANPEKVMSLEPDLIIVSASASAEYIEQFEKIAPTVATPFYGDPFERLYIVADIMGQRDKAEQFIADYEAEVAATREQLKDLDIKGKKALVLQITQKTMWVYATATFPTIYDALEFAPPQNSPEQGVAVSQEVLPDFDAEYLFITVLTDEAKPLFDELQSSGLWKNLPAVQAGHVYDIGNRLASMDLWNLKWGLGEVAAKLQQ